jgi:hypothetical protein
MSAAESARDARVTTTAPRLLPEVLHAAAAAAAGTLLVITTLGRAGHAVACLLLATDAAAVDCVAKRAILRLRCLETEGGVCRGVRVQIGGEVLVPRTVGEMLRLVRVITDAP